MSLNLPERNRRLRFDHALAIVNIVLLLIFYFLLVGQQPHLNSPLDLSATTSLTPESLPWPVLELRGPGEWWLDGASIRPEAMPSALAGGGPVYLLMDRAAPASLLVEALQLPELTGHDLRLVTQKDAAP